MTQNTHPMTTGADISPEAVVCVTMERVPIGWEVRTKQWTVADLREVFPADSECVVDGLLKHIDTLRSALTAATEYGQLKGSQLTDATTELLAAQASLTTGGNTPPADNGLSEDHKRALKSLAHIALGSMSHTIERYAANDLLNYIGELERQRTEARSALTASEKRVQELERMLSCPLCDGKLGSPGACDTCMADLVMP